MCLFEFNVSEFFLLNCIWNFHLLTISLVGKFYLVRKASWIEIYCRHSFFLIPFRDQIQKCLLGLISIKEIFFIFQMPQNRRKITSDIFYITNVCFY